MKKRILSVILTLALCLGLFAGFTVQAAEASGICGEHLTWSLSGTTLTIQGTGEMFDYNYWNEFPTWYDYKESISTVIIKAGVTNIGDYAFYRCGGLESVTLPDGMTEIKICAFKDCTELTSILLPDDLSTIGNSAFFGCTGLTSVTIPAAVTDIGEDAFSCCAEITGFTVSPDNKAYSNDASGVLYNKAQTTLWQAPARLTGAYTVPDTVTEIESYAFDGCTGLTSITLPDTLTEIGESAFGDCSGLTSLTLPDGLNTINWRAFYGCSGLKSLTLPDGLSTIGEYAFSECTGLTSLTLPDSVSTIGGYAFSGCTGLKSVTLPKGLDAISECTFFGCTGLKSVTLPDGLSTIDNGAFFNCTGLSAACFLGNAPSLEGDVFSLPQGDTEAPNPNLVLYYLQGKSGWTTPTWNGYPTKLWDGVNVPTDELPIADASGACGEHLTWSLSGTTLTIQGTGEMSNYDWQSTKPEWNDYRESISTVIIKTGVTSIGDYAFYGCSGLTSVTLPEGLSTIGDSAFLDGTGLTSITLPEGLSTIDYAAFKGCSSLTNLTLPEGLTAIGNSAFSGCSGLKSIALPESLTTIGISAFSECSGLTAFAVSADNTAYSSDASGVLLNKAQTTLLQAPGKLTGAYTAPATVTEISDYAFGGCSSLTSVTLPDGLSTIGNRAFSYCSSLTSLTLPDGLTIIGDYAFRDCSGLTSLTLPDGLTTIGNYAFFSCSGLTSVTLPDGLRAIGDCAFVDCTGLSAVCFLGAAPLLGWSVFYLDAEDFVLNPKVVLYYIEGKAGWTTPLWEEYPTKLWDGVNVPTGELPFTDVPEGKWYTDAVSFVYDRGLFAGITPSTFAPDGAMTRSMLVSVLWRQENQPAPKGSNPFADVPAGKWFTNAVIWAAENKIVSGTGEGQFNPNGNVTREQIAVMMLNYAKFKGRDTSKTADLSKFPDSGKVANWAKAALSWANAEGLVSGAVIDGQTVLNPQGQASRAQVASILMRYIQKG